MRYKLLFVFFILFSQGFLGSLQACSVCGCGDPLQPAGTVHSMAGDFHLSLEGSLLTASAQSDDNPAQTETLTQRTVSGIITFNPSLNLTLVGIIPYVEKDFALSDATDGSEAGTSAFPKGLGDINLGFRYFLLADMEMKKNFGSQNLAVSGGTFLPTGNIEALDSNGDRFDQHAQLGTGAWSPYLGLLYTGIVNDWTFSANLNALFHTVNSYDYHFGTALTWGAMTQVHLSEPFAVSLSVEGRTAGQDTSVGTIQTNTGGTVVDLTPGLWWSPAEDLGFYGKVQIPMAVDLYGTQTVGVTGIVGTQLLFH